MASGEQTRQPRRQLSEGIVSPSPRRIGNFRALPTVPGAPQIQQSFSDGRAAVRELFQPIRRDTEPLRSLSPALVRDRSSPIPESSSRPGTPSSFGATTSPRARWATIRRHVLPNLRPSAPSSRSGTPTPQANANVPSRSSTPKPSRLARLGFRQVVEHAREMAVDSTRRLAKELERTCWSIRSANGSKSKPERDPSATATSRHLPFISGNTFTSSNLVEKMTLPQARKGSDAQQSEPTLVGGHRPIPSVKPLYEILLQHSTPSTGPLMLSVLPVESLVLSTLLTPFTLYERGSNLDEERWLAFEAFEVITKTWAPCDEVMAVERYLWCCRAAFIPPSSLRTRILSTLFSLMVPSETNHSITSSTCFRTLAQGLFSLLPFLRLYTNGPTDQNEVMVAHDLIYKLASGNCGELDLGFLQDEYNAAPSTKEDHAMLRDAMILEALSRCVEDCTDATRLWLFRNVTERYWVKLPETVTPLLGTIHARAVAGFARGISSLLSVPMDQAAQLLRAQHVVLILQDRILPDLEILDKRVPMSTRITIVNLVLELICSDKAKSSTGWGIAFLTRWFEQSPFWKTCIDKALQEFVSQSSWTAIVSRFASLVDSCPPGLRQPIFATALPLLYDKLVETPPPDPFPALTKLLDSLSRLHPQLFYKPVFLCAASSKEYTVVNHLSVITSLAHFLPDFWIKDAEMVSIALLSDIGAKLGSTTGDGQRSWTRARLGQSVLLLEVIDYLQKVRHDKEDKESSKDTTGPSVMEISKFSVSLETRIEILLNAKEQVSITPPSTRLLFCMLFREIRLLTRSLKPAPWLSRVVDWFVELTVGEGFSQDPEEEEMGTIGQIQTLYTLAADAVRSSNQRRSTMLFGSQIDTPQQEKTGKGFDLPAVFAQKQTLLDSLNKGFVGKATKLLVAMSTLLTSSEYRRLTPHTWNLIAGHGHASTLSSLCYLLMQCAEKLPNELLPIIEIDLQSSDDQTRLNALQKLSILFNWRYQILSSPIVSDRARRPFKVTRGPLPFVATDMGSNTFIFEEEDEDSKGAIPLELRKRLAEIGWDQDDVIDPEKERIKTPLSLLPFTPPGESSGLFLSPQSPASPAKEQVPSSTEKPGEVGLLRRKSSSGGPLYGHKRRAVFVPALSTVFPRIASLVFDQDFSVSTTAKYVLIDLMRNDPSLLTRPVLDLLVEEHKDTAAASSAFQGFLHVDDHLPYPMSHHLFNSLAGFLKHSTRQTDDTDGLKDFAYVLPIVSRIIPQVSGMSLREIRRAKLDQLFVPSGSLWFTQSSVPSPMFPTRPLSSHNPFNSAPPDLVWMTMVRTSQNLLFFNILRRNRQDIQLVRKNMLPFELPALNPGDNAPLELKAFVPRSSLDQENNSVIHNLSLILSRSHLLLVTQIFRSMSRQSSDRMELANYIDGLNRILLSYGNDIGIVTHVLIALMAASTRFRRLFTSGNAYGLFMPAVLKVYAEAVPHAAIRRAIEYAANRFYALHQEAFVFQTLDSIGHIIALRGADADWMARCTYNLFFTIKQGITPNTPDIAGICDTNRAEEREALIVTTAEEKPQAFLSLLRRGDAAKGEKPQIDLPEEFQSRRLGSDDFVKLFLTVIAHDPSTSRAENFLKLLRFMAPHLYNASTSARTVLQNGVDALGPILTKALSKVKSTETPDLGTEDGSLTVLTENLLLEKAKLPSNPLFMKMEYTSLVVAFCKAGGHLSTNTTHFVFELVRSMLKEQFLETSAFVSTFLSDFIQASIVSQPTPVKPKVVGTILREVGSMMETYAPPLNISYAFKAIADLIAKPVYSNDPGFGVAIATHICRPGLLVAEKAASSRLLSSLPGRDVLVDVLARTALLPGANVIKQLEDRNPSYEFLAEVVLPLVSSLKTTSEVGFNEIPAESLQMDTIGRSWIRLLSYVIGASKSSFNKALERAPSPSPDAKNTDRLDIPTFLISLQIIKLIVVRGEHELSSRLSGIWLRIGALLQDSLEEGGSGFLFRAESTANSPSPSPRSSSQFDEPMMIMPTLGTPTLHRTRRTFASPRVIDYALWSFLEFLCSYRNPLTIQMRLFVQEKLTSLDVHLRDQLQGLNLPSTPRSRRLSTASASRSRRQSSSPMTTGFSYSPGTLTPSLSFPINTSLSSLEVGRLPGYQNVSSPQDVSGPQIVHLGPVSAMSAFGRALSLTRAGKSSEGMMATTKVKSPMLVHDTYRRIRAVQMYMGYEPLLPMPSEEAHAVEVDTFVIRAWTKWQAMEAIEKETKMLFIEFEQPASAATDDAFVDQSPVFVS